MFQQLTLIHLDQLKPPIKNYFRDWLRLIDRLFRRVGGLFENRHLVRVGKNLVSCLDLGLVVELVDTADENLRPV